MGEMKRQKGEKKKDALFLSSSHFVLRSFFFLTRDKYVYIGFFDTLTSFSTSFLFHISL